jgi:hypothetical protein
MDLLPYTGATQQEQHSDQEPDSTTFSKAHTAASTDNDRKFSKPIKSVKSFS